MSPDNFIAWLGNVASDICKRYGLPASMCIAQAAIESAWGQYIIGEYNLFGRKWGGWGNYIEVPTEEYYNNQWVTITDKFQDYNSLEEAIEDWCVLLTQEPIYMPCLEKLPDLEAYVRCVGSIYATDPDYADKVLNTIYACELTQFDV